MATIVNARDVLLQAASARVAGVTQTNLQVDQSQVTGLGLVLSGVKRLLTTPSAQVFLVPSVGSVAPTSIIISTSITGFAAVPVMSIVSGTISPIPPAIDGTFTLPATSMSSASAVIRISATDTSVVPNVTYTDDITLLRQVEGNTAVMGYLTQQDITLSADTLGNVVNYSGASGNFRVYQGTNDITSLCTFSLVSNTSGLTQTLNATTGAYAVTAGMPTGTDVATITYRATFGATTVDKTFTVRKAKATVVASGQRGSRTFYVTLSGSTNTYSDSLATITATVDGGPVKNDVVTQSNSSVGFSQSKFYDGTGWLVINAVVDGNLLVSGTVGANAIAAKAITTDKLFVSGAGQYINLDPHTQDVSAWTGGTFTVVTDGTSPNGRAIEITSAGSTTAESRYYQIDKNKNYLIRMHAKNISGTAQCYLGVDFCDVNGNRIDGTTSGAAGWPGLGSYFYYGLVGVQPPSSYTEYSVSFGPNETAKIPTGAVGIRIIILGNYNAAGTQRFAKMTLMEKTSAALVVDGTIQAQHLATDSVTAIKIQADAVTTTKIQAGAVTATKLSVSQLDAVSATIGLLRTSTSGQRLEVSSSVIRVYDSGNVLRVKLGDLS